MKIAVNLFLASPKSITGAFIYIEDILPALFRQDKVNTYFLLGSAETIGYFKSLYANFPNVKYRVFDIRRDVYTNPLRALKKLLAKLKNDYRARESIIASEARSLLKKEKIDIYFSPSSTIYPRGLESVKAVTTILDLQPDYFPENFPTSYLQQRKEDCQYAVEQSSYLIAISNYTKRTLEEKYAANPSKIEVIYFAPHEIASTPSDIAVPDDFIFYPAAIWPHKNHRVLIEAMAILKDQFPTLKTVCAGVVKKRQLKSDLETLAESLGLKERIVFPGYAHGGNLRLLYQKARALVFPSAFEGFGIPLVEAFQFGLPVVAANNSSITEVVADAGILVQTGDVENLAKAIAEVITNHKLRRILISKGYERARLFTWEKAAEKTLSIFNRLASDNKKSFA